ncbi:hypothetical protein K458DRAFT_155991 [Lentithecium fluviatile CBS 122367]|uniref:Uncharacterized protein n=1 Tax=Lentithecium fluviatile CBS 122367 TaxID=1168545 RepID=A0A6G1IIL5_9PLEO|nr:hypothetical protein K458DRAFT_155991 [Lentithecium fluviatile CBS 122367]
MHCSVPRKNDSQGCMQTAIDPAPRCTRMQAVSSTETQLNNSRAVCRRFSPMKTVILPPVPGGFSPRAPSQAAKCSHAAATLRRTSQVQVKAGILWPLFDSASKADAGGCPPMYLDHSPLCMMTSHLPQTESPSPVVVNHGRLIFALPFSTGVPVRRVGTEISSRNAIRPLLLGSHRKSICFIVGMMECTLSPFSVPTWLYPSPFHMWMLRWFICSTYVGACNMCASSH